MITTILQQPQIHPWSLITSFWEAIALDNPTDIIISSSGTCAKEAEECIQKVLGHWWYCEIPNNTIAGHKVVFCNDFQLILKWCEVYNAIFMYTGPRELIPVEYITKVKNIEWTSMKDVNQMKNSLYKEFEDLRQSPSGNLNIALKCFLRNTSLKRNPCENHVALRTSILGLKNLFYNSGSCNHRFLLPSFQYEIWQIKRVARDLQLQTTQTGGENADEIITLYKPAQPQ
jgi:hypothetical protein